MATLRSMISDARTLHRILSTDSMITDRAIASEIVDNALFLIKRETNLRRLWATDTLFTTIPCLEMTEVPISECCNYQEDTTIARSKLKLPRISEGNYQYVIQGVYSINAMGGSGTKLKEISINRYLNLLKLGSRKKDTYFWINNDYLYVTNSMVEKVRMAAFFEDNVTNDILYPEDCDCGGDAVSNEEYCMNPLDKQFACPGFLLKQVMDLTGQTLQETYFRIPEDVSSEGIDGQQVSTRPTRSTRSKDQNS